MVGAGRGGGPVMFTRLFWCVLAGTLILLVAAGVFIGELAVAWVQGW